VPGHTLAEPEAAEQAQGASQALLAVLPFVLQGVEGGWQVQLQLLLAGDEGGGGSGHDDLDER
jgi:hypothetical protein